MLLKEYSSMMSWIIELIFSNFYILFNQFKKWWFNFFFIFWNNCFNLLCMNISISFIYINYFINTFKNFISTYAVHTVMPVQIMSPHKFLKVFHMVISKNEQKKIKNLYKNHLKVNILFHFFCKQNYRNFEFCFFYFLNFF